MAVTFTTPKFANIILFDDVAERLLKLMGMTGKVPGALAAEDVPAALEKLKLAVDADKQAPTAQPYSDDDSESKEPVVSLLHRAIPLIELLTAAVKAKDHVMWE